MTEIKGGTWCCREGCVKVKQLCEERVVIRSIFHELIHFPMAKWIRSMYLGVD
jgi:hypothetical protein